MDTCRKLVRIVAVTREETVVVVESCGLIACRQGAKHALVFQTVEQETALVLVPDSAFKVIFRLYIPIVICIIDVTYVCFKPKITVGPTVVFVRFVGWRSLVAIVDGIVLEVVRLIFGIDSSHSISEEVTVFGEFPVVRQVYWGVETVSVVDYVLQRTVQQTVALSHVSRQVYFVDYVTVHGLLFRIERGGCVTISVLIFGVT